MTRFALIATTPLATEDLVAAELRELGADGPRAGRTLVRFTGPLELAYRACLWSRVANRVLLPFAEFRAADADALYEGARAVPWHEHLGPDDTLAVDFTERGSAVGHTRFGAQRVKDGVVDAMRERHGRRPSVDLVAPGLRLAAHLEGDAVTLSVDLAGASLHRRGYRAAGTEAPLKENLAAAMLLRARWPAAARDGAPLVDLLCGSGTIVIEAALMALDAAPGLLRDGVGSPAWRGHDAALWARLRDEAAGRRRQVLAAPLTGSDIDAAAVRIARTHAARARVGELVTFERCPVGDAGPPGGAARPGLVVVNPPYGERLGDEDALTDLYAELGRTLKQRFGGWSAHVLTPSERLASALGLAPDRTHSLWNGGIACRLLHYDIRAERTPGPPAGEAAVPVARDGRERLRPSRRAAATSAGAAAVANRLQKNLRNLGGWAAREGITCYRLYDADLPEYAAAVDRYEDLVHVQEYAPPASIDPERARQRFDELVGAVRDVLGAPPDRVFTKVRRRQRRGAQYGRLDAAGVFHTVREGGHRFLVNLGDYLDTGLFLDGRLIRRRVAELARGRRFLNLFSYTGSATVYAARGGAATTTSVDLSRTYLDWAERNLRLNGVAGRAHTLVQADARAWLAETRDRYGLILLDPPTFSSSKRMQGTLDVQRDHAEIIDATAGLLEEDGVLVFVTNSRRFRLDRTALPGLVAEDVSAATMPRDFAKNPRIHRCWLMRRRR